MASNTFVSIQSKTFKVTGTDAPETNRPIPLGVIRLDHEPFEEGEFRGSTCPPGVSVGVEGFEAGGENGLP